MLLVECFAIGRLQIAPGMLLANLEIVLDRFGIIPTLGPRHHRTERDHENID